MRTRVVWLTAAFLIGFMGFSPSHAQEVQNLLVNGGFEDGVLAPWTIWSSWGDVTGEVVQQLVNAAVPEDPIEGDFCVHLVVPTPPGVAYWECCLQHGGHVFEKGKKYTHSAFFKCKKGTMQIGFELQIGQDPWTVYSEQSFTITEEWAEYSLTSPVFAEDVSPGNVLFRLAFEVGDFWVDCVRFYEGDYVPPIFKPRVLAVKSSPGDGAVDVPQDVVMSWAPGELANTHNVYFGTVFDDVNNADTTNPLDVLVSQSQDANTYDPVGLLDFGQTYYWRIDEVNAPPDSTVFKGDVWRFTAEPFAYPIENITATSSSYSPGMGPEKTIDGSGLNDSDQHSTIAMDMWLSNMMGPQPTWIQYEFDRAYKLNEMWVWNSNQSIEAFVGFGAKDVTIEYSEDGADWTALGDVELTQATGQPDYTHNTTVNLGGVLAKYVRLTMNSNWGGITNQYGLSEVRFFYVPVKAREPKPASGQADVARDVVLDWRAGREAASHEVSFSSDREAVIDGTAPVGIATESRYAPGLLDFGQTYYWKVNEVNEAASPSSWEGDVWNFSTIEYFVVDDFEAYNDLGPGEEGSNRIFLAWIDGYEQPTNGSQVGYLDPPFCEQSIVHGGNQSMPLFYDNSGPANYSEATLTLSSLRDWTVGGVTELSLWFRGNPADFVEEPMGTYTMSASGLDIWDSADEFRYAYKQLSGNGEIVAQVLSVQNTDGWAKAGVMIRETLDAGSKHAFCCMTPANGKSFQNRKQTNQRSWNSNTGGVAAPYWVRLVRQGNTFTAYHSADGVNWELQPASGETANPETISMATNVYIGLALTSHNVDATCVAEFSDVQITGTVSPAMWTNQAIGATTMITNDPEPMYVTLNGSAVVYHDNPNAALINEWTEWNIDLEEFSNQGIVLTNVDSISIGFGDRNNPQLGGSGKMYFDDIRVGHPVPLPEQIENILANGGFEDGVIEPWGFWGDATAEVVTELVDAAVPEAPIEGDSCLHITVNSAGANNWDYGLNQGGHVFEAGKKYTVSAFLKCKEGTLDIRLKPERGADPWEGYGEQVFTMTDQWAEYSVTTPVFTEDVSPASITFHIAFAAGDFWVDGVRFYEGDYVPPDGSPVPVEPGNKLVNGGFEDGVLEPWNTYGDVTTEVVQELVDAAVPEAPIEGDFCLYVLVPTAAENFWDAGLQPQGEVFEAGKKYTISAFLKSKEGTLDINFKPELGESPWTGYGEQMITITDQWAEYSVTTPVFTEDVSPASFTFHIGSAVGGFWVDGVRFYEGDYVPPDFGN